MIFSNRKLALTLAVLCSYSVRAGEADGARASKQPTAEQMRAVSMPSYVPQPGDVEECLGRIVWSTDRNLEWPVRRDRDQSTPFMHTFSEHVFTRGNELRFGNTRISVNAISPCIREDVLASLPERRLSAMKKELALAKAEVEKTSVRKDGNIKERNAYEVALASAESAQKGIDEVNAKYQSFVPGVAGSYGYTMLENDTSVYRAYLFTDKYLYTFESREKISGKFSTDNHRQQFSKLLATFRPRSMNEIPSEPGVCIPFGFLPDDGRTVIDMKQALRWTDAPGVLYTIHTGTVQPRQLKSTVVMAAASADVGRFGTQEEASLKQYVDQRIGPRQVAIGALLGEQGGVALKVKKAGEQPYEAYSVFTGYAGWLGIDVLPFILVDMQTFTKAQAPELKSNPPPFKQSMQRLDGLLKNMRWRATSPPMAELVIGK